MTMRNRTKAFLLAFIMVFAVLLSSSFIAKESIHECCCSECSVCQTLRTCLDNTKNIVNDGEAFVATVSVLVFALCGIQLFNILSKIDTLVSLKVKISN